MTQEKPRGRVIWDVKHNIERFEGMVKYHTKELETAQRNLDYWRKRRDEVTPAPAAEREGTDGE